MVAYYIVNNGSSRNRDLHALIQKIKAFEVELECRIEVVRVPGKVMIVQRTDGLSRGIWASADRMF
jgi:hypothetical protein